MIRSLRLFGIWIFSENMVSIRLRVLIGLVSQKVINLFCNMDYQNNKSSVIGQKYQHFMENIPTVVSILVVWKPRLSKRSVYFFGAQGKMHLHDRLLGSFKL